MRHYPVLQQEGKAAAATDTFAISQSKDPTVVIESSVMYLCTKLSSARDPRRTGQSTDHKASIGTWEIKWSAGPAPICQ